MWHQITALSMSICDKKISFEWFEVHPQKVFLIFLFIFNSITAICLCRSLNHILFSFWGLQNLLSSIHYAILRLASVRTIFVLRRLVLFCMWIGRSLYVIWYPDLPEVFIQDGSCKWIFLSLCHIALFFMFLRLQPLYIGDTSHLWNNVGIIIKKHGKEPHRQLLS